MHAVCSLRFLSCLRSQNSITAWNITYHCRSLQIKAISSLRLLPIYCYSPKEAVLKLYIVTFPIWRRRGCTWTQNQLKIYTLLSFPSETWGGRHGHTKSIKKKTFHIWIHQERIGSWLGTHFLIAWRKEHCNFSISDRLCFAILYSRPKSASNEHYFSIDNELEYEK